MSQFTLQEILDATGGELRQFTLGEEYSDPGSFPIREVSTDTRTIEEGDLFLALRGEKFDGHQYAVAAVNDGAKALVLDSMEQAPENVPVVLVEDTKLALEQIAAWYRQKLGCTVVAVTGSVGKTSTREMIACALSTSFRVAATKNNENNEIGLSKTILSAPEDTEVIVLEMGMRLRGEISELTHIARPDVAVITNVGVAHIERLGTQENILLAKLEIIEGLKEGGLLILPYGDPLLRDAVKRGLIRKDVKVAYTSIGKVDFPTRPVGMAVADDVRTGGGQVRFTASVGFEEYQDVDILLNVVGVHHVGNALAGLLCGFYLKADAKKITEGVRNFMQVGRRECLLKVGDIQFLDDSYNAGPESMMAAFASIRHIAGEKKAYACIGDMLELGPVAKQKHFEIGKRAAELKLDALLIIGDYKEDVMTGALSVDPKMDVEFFESKEAMADELIRRVAPGDVVLLKASHSFEMHTILEDYMKKTGRGDEK